MLFEVKCRKMLIALFYGLRIAFTAFEMCSTHLKIEESLFVLQINCHSCRILRNGSYNNTQAFETLSNQMKLMQAKLVETMMHTEITSFERKKGQKFRGQTS